MAKSGGPPPEEEPTSPATDEGADEQPQKFQPVSTVQSLRMLAQNFGKGPPRAPGERPATAKEIVNGLDQREYKYGWIACALGIAVGSISYIANHRSTNLATRSDAIVYLIAFLVALACMVAGTALRRRALLGFAALLGGLELLSSHAGEFGIIYLAFGFWLIYRVTQRQKQQRDSGATTRPAARPSSRGKPAAPPAPKASKRYTPPRSRSSSGRRR